jgi:hypothetical protein
MAPGTAAAVAVRMPCSAASTCLHQQREGAHVPVSCNGCAWIPPACRTADLHADTDKSLCAQTKTSSLCLQLHAIFNHHCPALLSKQGRQFSSQPKCVANETQLATSIPRCKRDAQQTLLHPVLLTVHACNLPKYTWNLGISASPATQPSMLLNRMASLHAEDTMQPFPKKKRYHETCRLCQCSCIDPMTKRRDDIDQGDNFIMSTGPSMPMAVRAMNTSPAEAVLCWHVLLCWDHDGVYTWVCMYVNAYDVGLHPAMHPCFTPDRPGCPTMSCC